MKKPNFFIIGSPKCGTTSLSIWLREHPQIFFSTPKQPAYFNKDGITNINSLEEYEKLFINANSSHIAVGEGTPHYIYSSVAIHSILEYNKHAKFIVCIRNPVEMAYSMHSELLYQGEETVSDFEKAWRLQLEREKGYKVPYKLKKNPLLVQYADLCKHSKWLEKVYTQIDQASVLVVLLDDIKNEPIKMYKTILEYLNVDYDGKTNFEKYNTSKITRSATYSKIIGLCVEIKKKLFGNTKTGLGNILRKVNTYKAPRSKLTKEFHEELINYFRNDIKKLEDILDRDLSEWVNTTSA